jgi:hypothetical protein
MWTLLALVGCHDPAPPDDFLALRTYVDARCRLIVRDDCRENGSACFPRFTQTRAECRETGMFAWSACTGVETDIDLTFISDCVDLLRSFDCSAPCDGDGYAFDGGACADVIAQLETSCP